MKNIDETGFDQICECLEVRELHLLNREAFIAEEDPCDKIGIVISGAVRLSRRRFGGGRNVLETVMPGDTFGTTYAFRDVSAIGISACAVGETVVLIFNADNITRLCGRACEAHMQFIRNLLAVMSQKTFQIKQKLRILSLRTIRDRLMLFLQMMAKRAQSTEFDITFDRQAMADYLCVDRSALSSELSKLQREGKLKLYKNHFHLL